MQFKSERLNKRWSAVAGANSTRDLTCNAHVLGSKYDVESDQKRPGADRDCAGRRVNLGPAFIRRSLRVRRDLLAQQLQCTATYIFEIYPLGPPRRTLIEVHWNRKLARN